MTTIKADDDCRNLRKDLLSHIKCVGSVLYPIRAATLGKDVSAKRVAACMKGVV